jgi:hypothetical protein
MFARKSADLFAGRLKKCFFDLRGIEVHAQNPSTERLECDEIPTAQTIGQDWESKTQSTPPARIQTPRRNEPDPTPRVRVFGFQPITPWQQTDDLASRKSKNLSLGSDFGMV